MSATKKATKKNVAKQTTTRAIEKKSAAAKLKVIKEKQTRVEILQTIAEKTNLKRVQVESVFVELSNLIKSHMKKKGSGKFQIPFSGVKIVKIRRKATKDRKMVSPLTGQEVLIKSKPARDDVKLIALKSLKDAVEEKS